MASSKGLIIIFLLLFGFQVFAKPDSVDVIVYFKGKNYPPDGQQQPAKLFSEAALSRRSKQQIILDSTDFPVDSTYVQQLKNKGSRIIGTSRWLNAAYIRIPKNTTLFNEIISIPFVAGHKMQAGKMNTESITADEEKSNQEKAEGEEFFGFSFQMHQQINDVPAFLNGIRGQGMLIAVIDGGFSGVNKIPLFSHLFAENKIVATYDFVNESEKVFNSSTHGTEVLSIIAGKEENTYWGMASEASFILLKSEKVSSETPLEEFNLVRALEFADSAGAQVVNISLGYNDFDDTAYNYSWSDLYGKVSISSIACDIAVSKGMIVVTSNGNEGADPWRYLSPPADARKVISVGALDKNGNPAVFSSYGVADDTLIKPTLSALGDKMIVMNSAGNYFSGSGTSFAAPVIAGAVACLWQQFPDKSNEEIKSALVKSCHQYDSPDLSSGHGYPNLMIAALILTYGEKSNSSFLIMKNNGLYIYSTEVLQKATLVVKKANGKPVAKRKISIIPSGFSAIKAFESMKFKPGNYILEIESDSFILQYNWLNP